MRVARVPWSRDAESALADALGEDRDYIRHDIDQGEAQLWKLDDGKAWLVTRPEGRELVIVCFAGQDLRTWMRRVYQAARSRGYTTARFHTTRPAIARLCPFPAELVQYVYRVEIR